MISNFQDNVKDVLFPRRCVVCDKPVKEPDKNKLVCRECLHKLSYIKGNICMKCGKPIFNSEKEYCDNCIKVPNEYIDRGVALYSYEGMLRDSIYRFKYERRAEYGKFYGEEIAKCFSNFIRYTRAQALVPVPLNKKRMYKRGYNQAALLAKAMEGKCGVRVLENLVERTVNTAPMKNLNKIQREINLKKAFKIVSDVVKLNTIIVIDDIYTTGSTINAISKVFKDAGVQRVYFITLAIGKN